MKKKARMIMTVLLAVIMSVYSIPPSLFSYADDDTDGAAVQAEDALLTEEKTEEAEAGTHPQPEHDEEETQPAAEPEPVSEEIRPEPKSAEEDAQSGPEPEPVREEPHPEPEKEEERPEETAYPSQSFSGSTADLSVKIDAPEGAFPGGTVMKVRAVSASEVIRAAQSLTGSDSRIVDAAAADITFCKSGRELQPEKAVRVTLTAKRALSGDSHEAVTLDSSGAAEVMADAGPRKGSFSTDHFTVYGIVGEEYEDEDVHQYARHSYEYYVPDDPEADPADASAWTLADRQICRNGDRIALPPQPSADSAHVFDGWYREGETEKLKDGEEIVIAGQTGAATDHQPAGSTQKTVRVYARFDRLFRITMYTGENADAAVFDTVHAKDGETVALPSPDEAVRAGLIIPGDRMMTGWRHSGGTAADENKVTVNGADIELVPVIVRAHLISYDIIKDVMKDHAVPDGRVPEGGCAEDPGIIKGDVIKGYVFGGWYEGSYDADLADPFASCSEFDFSLPLTAESDPDYMVTLYAKWIPSDAHFTVEVYHENAHAHEEEFKLSAGETIHVDATAEAPVPVGEVMDMYPADRYEWFHRSGDGRINGSSERAFIEVVNGSSVVTYDSSGTHAGGNEDEAVVDPEGGTIVRVYYCRDTYRINFLYSNKGSSASAGGPWIVSGDNVMFGTKVSTLLNDTGKALAPSGFGEYAAPVITAKCSEWLHECTHITSTEHTAMLDAFLADPNWYFERQDFNGSGETVFDESNLHSPVKPNTNIGDGGDLYVLLYLKKGQKEYRFRALYYDRAYTAEEINSGAAAASSQDPEVRFNYVPKGRYGHAHNWNIGSEKEGYRLVTVTNYAMADGEEADMTKVLPDGMHSFTWINGSEEEGEVETIYIHYVPVSYTITFRQTGKRKGGRNYVNGLRVSEDTHEDDVVVTGAFFGQDIAGIIEDNMPDWTCLKDDRGRGYHSEKDRWQGDTDADGRFPAAMPARDLVFYKQWTADTYTVSFDLGGHEVNGRGLHEYTGIGWGAGIPDPKAEGLTDRGDPWTLIRWDVYERNPDGTKGAAAPGVTLNTPVRQDYYIQAVWSDGRVYSLLYDRGGHGTFGGTSAGRLADSKRYAEGAGAPLRFVPKADEGWVFTGWAAGGSAADSDKLYGPGDRVICNSENDAADGDEDGVILLVAQYGQIRRLTGVTYHSNYPSGSDIEKNIGALSINGAFVMMRPESTALGFGKTYTAEDGTEYGFVCWTNSAGEKIFSGSRTREYFRPGEMAAAGAEDNHLYAVWKCSAGTGELLVAAGGLPEGEVLGDYVDEESAARQTKTRAAGPATGDENAIAAYIGFIIAAALISAVIITRRP